MPAKYKGRYFFTERQLQEDTGTLGHLRKLLRDAFRELRQIVRSNLTNKRYMEAGQFLATATQMISALQFLGEILSSAREQLPNVVIFEVSPLCSNCTAPLHEPQDHPRNEIPALDPAHYAEFGDLLGLAQRTSKRLRSVSRRHKTVPDALTTGLKRFTDAVARELRHFQETATAPPPTIEFRVNGPDCSVINQRRSSTTR